MAVTLPDKPPRRRVPMARGIIETGIVTLVLVIGSEWFVSAAFDRHTALSRLGELIQRRISLAHLWFEEAVAGDAAI